MRRMDASFKNARALRLRFSLKLHATEQEILENIIKGHAAEQDILANILDKISAPPPRPAAAPVRKPVPLTPAPPTPPAPEALPVR